MPHQRENPRHSLRGTRNELPGFSLHREPFARQAIDVVRQPDHEQDDHEHEALDPGALHHAEGHRLPAHLLHDRPEDVAAVERKEGEEVDDRQREGDDRQDPHHLADVGQDRLAGDLV